MISTFNAFDAKLKATSFQFGAEQLTAEEKALLTAEIDGWDENILTYASDVLHDWASMEVPSQMLRDIAKNDLDIAQEIWSGGVGDTCQREILIDYVLKRMGMRSWPINMEGEQVSKAFHQQLIERAPKFGVKIIE